LKNGQTVHFCCHNCTVQFRASPLRLIEGASSSGHNRFYAGREMRCPVMGSSFKVADDTAAVKLKNGQVRLLSCFRRITLNGVSPQGGVLLLPGLPSAVSEETGGIPSGISDIPCCPQ
jgi:hypothetical protein